MLHASDNRLSCRRTRIPIAGITGARDLRPEIAKGVTGSVRQERPTSPSRENRIHMLHMSDADRNGLLDRFCHHIVGLSWVDVSPRAAGEGRAAHAETKSFCVSAFVISVRDIWYLVTAGHILHDLDRRCQAGHRIVQARLIDGLGSTEHFPPIVFALADVDKGYIDDGDGLDYAIIPLQRLYIEQLQIAATEPLDESAWTDIPVLADAYFVMGFPTQVATTSITHGDKVSRVDVGLATPLLPIDPVAHTPEELKRGAERFYAKVPMTTGYVDGREVTLRDIDGMSGGPVFAVKDLGERLRYWIIAVQSGWLSRSRILASCPIEPLVRKMADCLDACADETSEDQPANKDEEHEALPDPAGMDGRTTTVRAGNGMGLDQHCICARNSSPAQRVVLDRDAIISGE